MRRPPPMGPRSDEYYESNMLAAYVPTLETCDDLLVLRVLLHDFGLVWEDAPHSRRMNLVEKEPRHFDVNWDAFLAAYTEYLCTKDNMDPPRWVYDKDRTLQQFWYAGGCDAYDRARTVITTPGAFEMHRIWFPKEELTVV